MTTDQLEHLILSTIDNRRQTRIETLGSMQLPYNSKGLDTVLAASLG